MLAKDADLLLQTDRRLHKMRFIHKVSRQVRAFAELVGSGNGQAYSIIYCPPTIDAELLRQAAKIATEVARTEGIFT